MARSERLVAALTAIAVIPIWLFRYVPTQDGPSHLYNAFAFARIGAPSSTVLREYFLVNLRLFPNWTTYVLMAPLTRILPPLVVQQIIVSLCVIAIPVAAVYLQKSFKGAVDASSLLSVMLAYSYMLFMGFFNFVLGAALFCVAVGFWWRQRDGNYLVPLYGLLMLLYLTHALPFAAAVISIAIVAVSGKRWRVLLHLLPAMLLLAIDAVRRMGAPPSFRSPQWKLTQVVDLRPFVYFGEPHVWIARAVLVAIIVCILLKLRGVPPPSEAVLRRRAAEGAGAPLITAFLFIAYLVAPWGYGAGGWSLGGWINDRFLFLAVLTLPAWLEVPRRATAIGIALVALHFAITAFDMGKLNKQIAASARAASLVQPHSTIQTFGSPGDRTRWTTPMQHVPSYLALQDDVVNLSNYEARLADFPMVFRKDAPVRPPDYLVVWREAQVRGVAGYQLLYTSDDIRLFRRAGL